MHGNILGSVNVLMQIGHSVISRRCSAAFSIAPVILTCPVNLLNKIRSRTALTRSLWLLSTPSAFYFLRSLEVVNAVDTEWHGSWTKWYGQNGTDKIVR